MAASPSVSGSSALNIRSPKTPLLLLLLAPPPPLPERPPAAVVRAAAAASRTASRRGWRPDDRIVKAKGLTGAVLRA